MQGIKQIGKMFLPKGSFARSVSLLAGGTAVGQALIVLGAPLLTRLYSVTDFGYLQIYMSVMSFAVLGATLRYDQAILLPERDDLAADVVAVSLVAVILTTTITCVLILLLGK